jgi:hypothetical protein
MKRVSLERYQEIVAERIRQRDAPKNRCRGLCGCGEHAWAVLTKGFVTFVSPEDAHFLLERQWYARTCRHLIYASSGGGKRARQRHVQLHREILGADALTDHVDHNGLNNRRANLRPCTHSQNLGNSRQRISRSGFRGVYFDEPNRRWMAAIADQHLGSFASAEAAARAYDAAAIERFGEFAKTNFGGAP